MTTIWQSRAPGRGPRGGLHALPTVERVKEVLEPRDGVFYWKTRPAVNSANKIFNTRFAGKPIALNSRAGYSTLVIDYCGTYLHRLIWAWEHNEWPKGEIDHINGDITDNSITNLRDVSRSKNQRNRRHGKMRSASGVPGVRRHSSGKWQVRVRVASGRYKTKLCSSLEEAANIRSLWQAEHGFTERHCRDLIEAMPGDLRQQARGDFAKLSGVPQSNHGLPLTSVSE